ncbi:energy transducer TonB [Niveibacterium terrae]|uniref:cell envelope integrity protein TolA n=1 Tax=Niveibacterium terrae TaxID=3373598 RepID=UPI003A8CAD48
MENNPAARIPEAPGKYIAGGFAVLVHLMLTLVLFWGVSWQRKAPESYEVALVQADTNTVPEPASTAPPPPPPAQQDEAEKAEKPAPVEHREAAEEPRPTVKPDIALPEPKKKKPEKKPEPEPKPEPKPEKKPDTKPEPKAKNEPARTEAKTDKKTDSKRKSDAKASDQPDLKAAAAADLKRMNSLLARDSERARQQAMMGEDAGRIAGARAKAGSDRARDEYINKIRIKVRGNIVVPPGISGNPEAVFSVDQLPTGEVMSVRLTHSSGSAVLDSAIERAIRKSSPLPLPGKSELFDRHLDLKIRPLDQ